MNKLELLLSLLDDDKTIQTEIAKSTEGVRGAHIIRTVTHTYTGNIVAETSEYFQLNSAAWIADSGRWMNAIKDGTLDEVEPMGDGVYIAKGAIVDITPWNHDLPSTQK